MKFVFKKGDQSVKNVSIARGIGEIAFLFTIVIIPVYFSGPEPVILALGPGIVVGMAFYFISLSILNLCSKKKRSE